MSNIYIAYNRDHMKNRSIIDIALGEKGAGAFFSEIFLQAAVFLVEAWRDLSVDIPELSEVGSNRTILDTVTRSIAYSKLAREPFISKESFSMGVRDALYGRIRARGGDSFLRNEEIVKEFMTGSLDLSIERGFRMYWCTFFKRDLEGSVSRAEKLVRAISSGKIPAGGDGDLLKKYILRMERNRGTLDDGQVLEQVVSIMNGMSDFGCTERRE